MQRCEYCNKSIDTKKDSEHFDCLTHFKCMEEEENYNRISQEMATCGECQDLKMSGVIPACCQYHMDKQFC